MPKKPAAKKMTSSILKKNVDRLGEIKALIADLNEEAKVIRTKMINQDCPEMEGRLFCAKVSTFDIIRVDYKGIVELYDIPQSVIDDNSYTTEQTKMIVSAR